MSSAALSMVFSALADPTRRAILQRLSRGEAPVKDLAEPFALSGPAITKHLKVLERAGLITRSRDGQQRPCRLEPGALEPAASFLEEYRVMWEERLDRLGEHLKRVAHEGEAPRAAEAKSKATSRGTTGDSAGSAPRTRAKRAATATEAKSKATSRAGGAGPARTRPQRAASTRPATEKTTGNKPKTRTAKDTRHGLQD